MNLLLSDLCLLQIGLTGTGLAFETVLWFSSGWIVATSGKGDLPDPFLLDQAQALLNEAMTRTSPVDALMQFITMAQGRRPNPTQQPEIRQA